jgi:hypothetical protein
MDLVGLGRTHFFDLSRKRKLLRNVSQFSQNFVNFLWIFRENFSRKLSAKTFRENLNLTKSGIKYQFRKNILSRIRGFLASWIRIRQIWIRSGSWSYLRKKVTQSFYFNFTDKGRIRIQSRIRIRNVWERILGSGSYPCQNPMDPEHWNGDIFLAYERQKVLSSVKVEGEGFT